MLFRSSEPGIYRLEQYLPADTTLTYYAHVDGFWVSFDEQRAGERCCYRYFTVGGYWTSGWLEVWAEFPTHIIRVGDVPDPARFLELPPAPGGQPTGDSLELWIYGLRGGYYVCDLPHAAGDFWHGAHREVKECVDVLGSLVVHDRCPAGIMRWLHNPLTGRAW